MASKNKAVKPLTSTTLQVEETPVGITAPQAKDAPFSILNFRVQAAIIAVLGFMFYCNTFVNGWAFDDSLVIVNNDYVQMGLAGIPKILTGDAFESAANGQNATGNELTGGRYRPLSIITFAMEQQALGTSQAEQVEQGRKNTGQQDAKADKLDRDMHFRHVVNVLLYVLSVVVLLYFLRKIVFKDDPLVAFFAALIFTIHPLHTEVVANVKSRDEILSLLFICLTFITSFKYLQTRKKSDLFISLLCFLLALLSKEYGVVMLVLLPLAFYWFNGYDIVKSFKAGLVYLVPFAIYLLMRFSSVKTFVGDADPDVMNNPYLLATGAQKIATLIYVPLDYIRLLFFPHPLAADYSFNQVPYVTFADYRVWLSMALHTGLLALMIMLFRKRNVLGFAIAFYFVFLALVSNVFVNIGTPMGERLIYHSSVGFAVIAGYFLAMGYRKMKPVTVANFVIGGLVLVLVAVCGASTIARNKDWKSDNTLFRKDVQTVPNSVIANNNAAYSYIKESNHCDGEKRNNLLKRALPYCDKAISINPKYVLAYLNRGICYYRLGEIDKAHADCDTVIKYYPLLPVLSVLAGPLSSYYTKEGIKYGSASNDSLAILMFRKAADVVPLDGNILRNLGMQYVKDKRFEEAKVVLVRTLQLQPGDEQARELLRMAESGQ